jgi:hypothetical protein
MTNPRKAACNRVYNGTTRGCLVVVGIWGVFLLAGYAVATGLIKQPRNEEKVS